MEMKVGGLTYIGRMSKVGVFGHFRWDKTDRVLLYASCSCYLSMFVLFSEL